MTLHEEALEIRKKICATAPQVCKDELRGKPWEVAVVCAQAYYRTHEDESTKRDTMVSHTLSPVTDTEICDMYDMGRSVLYISLYLNIPVEGVIKVLAARKRVVICDPTCSLSRISSIFPKGVIPAVYCTLYPNLSAIKSIPDVPPFIDSKPDKKEIDIIKMLQESYSIDHLVQLTNRPSKVLNFILQIGSKPVQGEGVVPLVEGASDEKEKRSMELYKKGLAPYFIAALLDEAIGTIESWLIKSDVPYYSGNSLLTIRHFLHFGQTHHEYAFPFVYEPEYTRIKNSIERATYKAEPKSFVTGPLSEEEKRIANKCLDIFFSPFTQERLATAMGREKYDPYVNEFWYNRERKII